MSITLQSGSRKVTLLAGKGATNILRLAEGAYLPSHFENIVVQIEKLLGKRLEWLPLGGAGRVAHSALGSSGEATHLLTEPIINSQDAALEMMHRLECRKGDAYEPQSISDAARHWFEIPEGGLPVWDTALGGRDRAAFEHLARQSQVIVRQGSKGTTPTIVFRDIWLGQHPADHEDTILSIHKGLKADVPYLAGQYGHGAAFTFAFSNGGQILVSRRHPDLLAPGYDDLVGLSLVRRRMPSETGSPNPSYWYAVCPDAKSPLGFSPEALSDPRWHGLHRVCIDYEMQKTHHRDIYYALEYNISNPTLPYAFKDDRPGAPAQNYFMSGIDTRLQRAYDGRRNPAGQKELRVPYRQTTVVDLDAFIGDGNHYGSIEVTTSFVEQEDNSKPSERFVPAKEAELWTLNGQRHHARPRAHFGRAAIGLEAIRDNLVVEVKLDKLAPDAKAMLLTTDRQGAAERGIRFQVEEAIDEQLRIDTELKRLNESALAAALSKAAGSSFADLDRELVQFENLVRKETQKFKVKKQEMKSEGKNPPPRTSPLKPIAPLHPHPTYLSFRKQFREVIRVAPGKTASLLLEADAVDGYFGVANHPSYQFTPATGSALVVYSHTELQGGRMRVRMKAAPNAAHGKTKLTASCLPPTASLPLTTSIDVEIATPKPRTGRSGRIAPMTVEVDEDREIAVPPRYKVVYRDGKETWASLGLDHWTTDTVAEYKSGIVYINGDYDPLITLLKDGATAQAKEYLRLYIAPVVMSVVGLSNEETNPPKDEDGNEQLLPAPYRDAAYRAAALGAIFTIRKLKKLGLGGMDEAEA